MLLRSLIAVCLLVLVPSLAAARTWYVNNLAGGDHLTGYTATADADNGPFRTIAMALHVADRGDRIELAGTPVPYYEMIALSGPRHQGFADEPFTIVGNGAILDGSVAAEFGAWEPQGGAVFAMRPRRLTFQQLFASGRPLTRVAIDSTSEVDSLLPPGQWALADGRMWLKVEGDKLPQDYDLRHCGMQTGVTLYNVKHVRIENLVVQGFHTDGINAHELVRDCELVGVECRANGRSGLSVGGVSRVKATGSYFYDNGAVQVRVEQQGKLALTDSEADDKVAPQFSTAGGELVVDGKEIVAP